MRYKYIFIVSIYFALSSPVVTQAQQIKDLSVGDPVSVTSDESRAISEKVRQQIVELSQGILHGAPQFSMIGDVELTGGKYYINGDTFEVDKHTVIYGDFKPGAFIEVRGNLVPGKAKVAKQIVVGNQQAESNSGLNSQSSHSATGAADFPVDDRR